MAIAVASRPMMRREAASHLCRSPRRRSSAVATVVLGCALVAPAVARANAAAPFSRDTSGPTGVFFERATTIRVEREELVIVCEGTRHPTCRFEATYFLHNRGGSAEELLGAFYELLEPRLLGAVHDPETPRAHESRSRGPGEVSVKLDGAPVDREATAEQLARMDALVLADEAVAKDVRDGSRHLHRSPFRLSLGPDARARLLFAGELSPTEFRHEGALQPYTPPAVAVRHPVFGATDSSRWVDTSDAFVYLITPLSGWAGDPEITVTIRHDAGAHFAPESPTSWSSARGAGVAEVVERTTMRPSAKQNLRFRLERSSFPLKNGGPLVGMGPRIGREELRLRAGFEVSGPAFLVYGLAVETNLERYATGVATVEVATPSLFYVIPSAAFGVGLPVQWRKDEPTRVGARGVLTLSWPVLSFLFPVDVYPTPNSSGSRVEGSFLTQLSF